MAGRVTRSKAQLKGVETEAVNADSHGPRHSSVHAKSHGRKRKTSPAIEVSEQPLLKKAKDSDVQGLPQELPIDMLLEVRKLVHVTLCNVESSCRYFVTFNRQIS